ncbi:glutathione peroxidase [Salinimicrobium sp. TIG7-5_MAKvit]|uniref:glutathione peroxidase n=1 Tax=Salinimicrobium sp. TIG7-5_MAKvit TaxID=3121289 RepID=UPI003C6DEB27
MTNRSTTVKSQSLKQKVLRFMYPLIKKLGKKGKNGTVLTNEQKSQPLTSLYNLKIDLNTGKKLELQEFKGKKLILVNTASNCGYTGQYSELQSLQERYGNTLQVIAFPANDFAGQEKSEDNEIAEFCQMNYGVTFPVAKKAVVVKNEEQHELFKWLTNKDLNGWNHHAPDWNFSKYIVDENGLLTHYFGPSISPLEEQFLRALE